MLRWKRPDTLNARTRALTALRCAALAAAFTGLANVPVAAGGTTFVPDTTVGPGPGHFRYYGRWEHVRNAHDGRSFGTSSRTSFLGAAVTFTFIGKQVRVYGVRGPGGGHGVITLDGTRIPDVDFYATQKHVRASIFVSPILRYGTHTLAIAAVADTRSSLRKSSYINISGATYR